jgi:hypothetical protein
MNAKTTRNLPLPAHGAGPGDSIQRQAAKPAATGLSAALGAALGGRPGKPQFPDGKQDGAPHRAGKLDRAPKPAGGANRTMSPRKGHR